MPISNSIRIMASLIKGDMLGVMVLSETGLPKGSVYTTLHRLKDEGYTTTKGRPGTSLQFWELTKQGRTELRELRSLLDDA